MSSCGICLQWSSEQLFTTSTVCSRCDRAVFNINIIFDSLESSALKMRSLSWLWLLSADLSLLLALSSLLLLHPTAAEDTLEAVDDQELAKLIDQEQYVLVLFGECGFYLLQVLCN